MTDRTCSMPECDLKHCAHGLCKKHYYAAGHGFQPKQCKVVACELMTTSKTGFGLCENHYALWRRNGTTTPTKFAPTKSMSPADVLWLRSEPHGDCVLWTGGLTADGYPQSVSGEATRAIRAHRLSYLLAFGPVPPGLTTDHTCHTNDPTCVGSTCKHRRCINPDHLEAVSQEENGRRQWRQRRAHAALSSS